MRFQSFSAALVFYGQGKLGLFFSSCDVLTDGHKSSIHNTLRMVTTLELLQGLIFAAPVLFHGRIGKNGDCS